MPAEKSPRIQQTGSLRRLAPLPIPVFLIAIGMLAWLHVDTVWNTQYLLPALNIIFLTGISLLISCLAANSHLTQPSGTVLMLGCGTLSLGMAGALAVFPPAHQGPNWTATIYYSAACLAAACHLVSAIHDDDAGQGGRRAAWPFLAILYPCVMMLVLLLALAVDRGALPFFFIEGQGATALNRAALWTAAGMFIISAALFRINHRTDKSAFVEWYSLGLVLIATGLVGLSLQKRFGSPLTWCGCSAQYLGGVYMLCAVLSTFRRTGRWQIPLASALREMEERYRSLVELCPDAILVHNLETCLFANPAALKLFGAGSAEQLIGRSIMEMVHPDCHEAVAGHIRERQSSNRIMAPLDVTLARLDGTFVDVAVTDVQIEYHGKPAIQVVMRDVTERRRAAEAQRQAHELLESRVQERTAELARANEALRVEIAERQRTEMALLQSKMLLQDIIDNTDSMIYLVDLEGRFLLLNRPLEKLFGVPREKMIGNGRGLALPAAIAEQHRANDQVVIRDRTPILVEEETDQDDGRHTYLSVKFPLFDPEGQLYAVGGISTDITGRKRAEEELRRSEARMRQAQNLAKLGVWEWEVATDTTIWSDEMFDIYGISAAEFTGRGEDYINFTHPDDRAKQRENIRRDFGEAGARARKTGELVSMAADPKEFRIIRKDGSIRYVRGDAVEVVDTDGRPVRMHGILWDITDRKRAELELLASEEHYRTLFTHMNEGFALCEIICDEAGVPFDYRVHEVNPAYEACTGLKLIDVTGRTARELFPGLEPSWIEIFGRVALTGEPIRFENYNHNTARYYDMFAFCPAPGRFAVLLENITERKRAADALRESEERLRLFIDHAPAALAMFDRQMRYLSVSQRWMNDYGLGADDLQGRSHYDVFPEISEYWKSVHRRGLEGEVVRAEAERFDRADGSVQWLRWEVRPWRDAAGQVAGIVIFSEDITARKQAEEALTRSKAELVKAQAITHIGSWWMTLTDGGQNWSGSAELCRIYGYPPDAALTMQNGLDCIHPDDRQASMAAFTAALEGTGSCAWEHRIVVDGHVKWIQVRVEVHRDESGQPLEVIGTNQDITVQRQLEEQLRQSQKLDAIGQLAGGIAHDFNNMLTGILGYANMLKLETTPDSSVYEAADVIEKAAERAADLTQKILGFARRGKFLAVPVDMNELVHDVVGLLDRTVDRKINITQRLGSDTPFVLGDPGQLQQAILNLALNARDAMAGGGELTIETRLEALDEAFCRAQPALKPGRYAVVVVSDTGCGIAAEIRDRIFEPFFTTKPQGEGTGMGLAMVYGIVCNHGGQIDIASQVGRGSTFKVYLPLHVDSRSGSETRQADPMPRKLGVVLLVDDEPILLKVAGKMLRKLGYEVLEASCGQEAAGICAARADQIKLAIIDMVMPGMDGGETLAALRQIKPDLKTILSSGYGLDGRAQEIVDRGMQGFIQKPYNLNEFAETVARVLRGEDPAQPDGRLQVAD